MPMTGGFEVDVPQDPFHPKLLVILLKMLHTEHTRWKILWVTLIKCK